MASRAGASVARPALFHGLHVSFPQTPIRKTNDCGCRAEALSYTRRTRFICGRGKSDGTGF